MKCFQSPQCIPSLPLLPPPPPPSSSTHSSTSWLLNHRQRLADIVVPAPNPFELYTLSRVNPLYIDNTSDCGSDGVLHETEIIHHRNQNTSSHYDELMRSGMVSTSVDHPHRNHCISAFASQHEPCWLLPPYWFWYFDSPSLLLSTTGDVTTSTVAMTTPSAPAITTTLKHNFVSSAKRCCNYKNDITRRLLSFRNRQRRSLKPESACKFPTNGLPIAKETNNEVFSQPLRGYNINEYLQNVRHPPPMSPNISVENIKTTSPHQFENDFIEYKRNVIMLAQNQQLQYGSHRQRCCRCHNYSQYHSKYDMLTEHARLELFKRFGKFTCTNHPRCYKRVQKMSLSQCSSSLSSASIRYSRCTTSSTSGFSDLTRTSSPSSWSAFESPSVSIGENKGVPFKDDHLDSTNEKETSIHRVARFPTEGNRNNVMQFTAASVLPQSCENNGLHLHFTCNQKVWPKPSIVHETNFPSSYPGRRCPDFTLDVQQSEKVTKKIKSRKKERCWCRLAICCVGFAFLLFSVMLFSMVLTRGEKLFGSL